MDGNKRPSDTRPEGTEGLFLNFQTYCESLTVSQLRWLMIKNREEAIDCAQRNHFHHAALATDSANMAKRVMSRKILNDSQ